MKRKQYKQQITFCTFTLEPDTSVSMKMALCILCSDKFNCHLCKGTLQSNEEGMFKDHYKLEKLIHNLNNLKCSEYMHKHIYDAVEQHFYNVQNEKLKQILEKYEKQGWYDA